MRDRSALELTLEDHEKAFIEISFLLSIFAATLDNLMGGATASVGRIAGRQMAKKLPFYIHSPGVEEVLKSLVSHFQMGFEISFNCTGGNVEMSFGRCAIREVCSHREIPVGGPLCKLFHYYFDGMVNEIHFRPVKSDLLSTGEQCRTRMEVR